MTLGSQKRMQIEKILKPHGFRFARLFGSALTDFKKARDIDIALEDLNLSFKAYSQLITMMERVFNKTVDLVFLNQKLSPILIAEIGAKGKNIWESSRVAYIESMDPLLAVAHDELVAYPLSERLKDIYKAGTQHQKIWRRK